MSTLITYYSKTGNSKNVAQRLAEELGATLDEIVYDEKAHSISENAEAPSGYERVILVCPIWAFNLPEPMSLFLNRHKDEIKRYSLIVTCSLGGLRGCVRGCARILGSKPEQTLKIKAKSVKSGSYSLEMIAR